MDEMERKEAASKIFDAVSERLAYLHGRWLDEREYEDFKDYEKSMREELSRANSRAEFLKGSKRPFGFTYQLGGALYQVSSKIRGSGCDLSYTRIR